MKKAIKRIILFVLFLLAGILFLAKFAGPALLKTYVEIGMGGPAAYRQPVFSVIATEEIDNFPVDQAYIQELTPYKYPDLELLLPKKFSVTKHTKTSTTTNAGK